MQDLTALLERLRRAQRELVLAAAKAGGLPADNTLRKISDLENTILAVEAVIRDEGGEP